ncbi:MAG TPA: response regulator [Candidatus Saccharimonadales bacterium]|nr:response regulator [Candidatus Saccharimonadales bacterium]
MTKKILIVEDEPELLTAVAEKLESTQYQLFYAHNGEEGLRMAMSEKPDLILLDLIMPVMNGQDMLENLRNNDWGKSVPVIILTNVDPNDTTIDNVVKNTPAYYFIKSNTTLEEIADKVSELLFPKEVQSA